MRKVNVWGTALAVCALGLAGCDEKRAPPGEPGVVEEPQARPDPGGGGGTGTDAGVVDAGPGSGGGDDGGTPDGGSGGSGGETDGGVPTDGGTQLGVTLPTLPGWTFYGPEQGGPQQVLGVSADEGGNVWVAGGEEGLFLLEAGKTRLRRFTMADGLRPYGYMPGGGDPPGEKWLKVLSVAGGPAGTVFVGYAGMGDGEGGKKLPDGVRGCETNFDTSARDPAVYKSGDADRVTLKADGTLSVVHYDIFSGPDVNPEHYPTGREKVCSIFRIAWDKSTNSVWFAGNHGFVRGDASYRGQRKADGTWCNGSLRCSGVEEHAHPHLNAYNQPTGGSVVLLTWRYRGLALEPNGDVWVGGHDRSTRFLYGTKGNFWDAQSITEFGQDEYTTAKIDIWKDANPGEYSRPQERTDDNVTGIARGCDGTVYATSIRRRGTDAPRGVARINGNGIVMGYIREGLLFSENVYVAADSSGDCSLWIASNGGGLTRYRASGSEYLHAAALGADLAAMNAVDIQMQGRGEGRRVLVAFQGTATRAGAIGIYSGR